MCENTSATGTVCVLVCMFENERERTWMNITKIKIKERCKIMGKNK